jgi:two-component system, NtrC family, sensor kinase
MPPPRSDPASFSDIAQERAYRSPNTYSDPNSGSRLLPRLGLRAQIVLALGVIYALLVALLASTTVELVRRANKVEQARFAQKIARTLVASAQRLPENKTAFAENAKNILHGEPWSALQVERAGAVLYERGSPYLKPSAELTFHDGGILRLWLREPTPTYRSPLTNLLIFYVALTGAIILVLTYISLTYGIVRPIEGLIEWSERLARSSEHLDPPKRGAAEIRRLAAAFGEMAAQLREERASLEKRLRQLEQTTQSLRSAQRQVLQSEKLATVGRLAAGVAHEIGNPLAAILGLAELLKTGELSERERREFLERIYGETERIHHIIRDLLDFSRQGVDSGELEVTSDLSRVVEDAINLVKPLKEFRQVRIEQRSSEALPRVIGPQHRLTQVVLNLLLNAADSMDGKGIIKIEIAGSDSERVILAITDDGPGIAPEVVDRLFEPFTTTKPVGKGTGLGLAVSYTLIESLGGLLSGSNLPQGGARFEIELQAAAQSSEKLI